MRNKKWQRAGIGLALALIVLGLVLPRAWAQGTSTSPRDKFRGANSITIPAGETIPHDLYVAGGTVRIDGRIDGDLFVAGGTVDVTGPVTGDLFATGGTVTISGPVDRHLRVAGGNVTVSAPVRLDLLAAVGTLTLTSAAKVGGDLIFTASNATVNGSVDGNVLGSAQAYTEAGRVGGSDDVTIQQQRPRQRSEPSVASRVFDQIRRFLSIALAGILLLWLVPHIAQAAAERTRDRPLPAFGVGLLTFAALFAAVLALLIGMLVLAIPLGLLGFGGLSATIVFGILLLLGLLAFAFAVVLLFIAAAIVGLALGRLILRQLAPQQAQNPYWAMLLGVLIIVIVTAIPLLGGILNAIVVVLGLGALILLLPWFRSARPPAPA